MRSYQFLLLFVAAAVSVTGNGQPSFTIGSTDGQRCFEESRLPLSDDGVSYCDRAIREGYLTRRDLAATFSNRGLIHAAAGRYDEALRDQAEAIRLMPTLGQAYINRGNVHYHTRDFDSALADYERAIELKATPTHIPHYNSALVYIRLSRKSEARAALARALALSPDSKRIQRQLADLQDPE